MGAPLSGKANLALASTLALLHTSPTLTPLFTSLCRKYLPQTEIFHMVDESLIQQTIAAGKLQKVTARRQPSMSIACASEKPANTSVYPIFPKSGNGQPVAS